MGLTLKVFNEIIQFLTFQALSNASALFIDHLSIEEIVKCEDVTNRYMQIQELKESERPILFDLRFNWIETKNPDLYRIIKEK